MVKDDEYLKINKVVLWQGATAILGILLIISVYTGGFGGKNDSASW
ncbi:hypothetical protein GOV05_04835 [Candidatus Woesearchaeota archaeon]|nr:hypothetical protein [Candidatus Woesearchaeota archaeon]